MAGQRAALRGDNAVYVVESTLLHYPEIAFAGPDRVHMMAIALLDALDEHGYEVKERSR